ncbi:hypothetical protein NW062_02680 [Mycoplasmopsis cynos]|nr:hypothetical protein NW062_02680 [Mycoplasmopsis cynos]
MNFAEILIIFYQFHVVEKDELENFIAVHCETNTEKANKFPHFKANNKSFEIRRSNKGFNKYEIVRIK